MSIMETGVSTPRVEHVEVTPSRALEILSRNTHNRAVRQGHVNGLASDMRARRWRENGETIKIATDGRENVLIDGQHRLWAVVESNTTQQFWIVTGLPLAAQDTVDIGRVRSASDIMGLEGLPNSALASGIVHYVLRYERFPDRVWSGTDTSLTKTEIVEWAKRNPRFVQLGVQHAAEVTNVKLKTSVYGAVSILAMDDAPSAWLEFHEKVKTGVDLHVGDPALALRNFALGRQGQLSGFKSQQLMAVTIKAFKAHLEGREYRLMRFSQDNLPMPRVI